MKSQFMHVELYSREEPAKKTINKSKNINNTIINNLLSKVNMKGKLIKLIIIEIIWLKL